MRCERCTSAASDIETQSAQRTCAEVGVGEFLSAKDTNKRIKE